MISMIAIERLYRHMLAGERLERIQGEIASTAETLVANDEDSAELLHLERAEQALRLAVRALQEAQAEARAHCQEEMLEAQLLASIELINRSPDRLRARENGERA